MTAKPTSITDIEIEAKVGAAVMKAARTKNLSDMGRRDFIAIVDDLKPTLSPEAYRQMVRDGVFHCVKRALGEKVAEAIWKEGRGWPSTDAEIVKIAHSHNIRIVEDPGSGTVDCLATFKEDFADATLDELKDWSAIDRFNPLFFGQPEDATLGEVATRKAAMGDKLALSFLAWKDLR
ncbi:hypothetical protein [Georhizobium sp. MAB10]|uniref:hypothetical protein n=1 Tax=Georhizobium sp. MAB10 TaxID=3028319 RepID=UPI003855DD78